MADIVRNSGYGSSDFFIWTASGTEDFAYHEFRSQIEAMAAVPDGTFKLADSEADHTYNCYVFAVISAVIYK